MRPDCRTRPRDQFSGAGVRLCELLDGVPVEDVLRKLIILGGRAGSSELRDWASRALRGYADASVDDLPTYRKIPAIIQMGAVVAGGQVRHQTVGPHELPKEARDHVTNQVPFYQGVGEIQALIANAGDGKLVRIGLPGERMLAQMIDRDLGDPFQRISAIYWSVSTSALQGLVDQIRTRLAELLGELRAGTPATADVPTAAQAANAVNVVINGKGNRVNVAHADSGGAVSIDRPQTSGGPFWTAGKMRGGAPMFLSSGEVVLGLIEGSVAEHCKENVAAASGEGDEGLVVPFSLGDLAVVVGP